MAKTYSLNDLGVTADDLILLSESGYDFDETDNISEEKRDEILAEIYKVKQKAKENAPKEAPAGERKAPEIPAATPEQLKDMNYRLKHGEHLSAQEVASAVAAGGIVSKEMRAEIKNTIVNFTNADNVSEEEAGAVAYLLDELDGKHIEKHKNKNSVEIYNRQFADNPEILEAAGNKLEDVNNAPASVVMYSKEDIDALLKQGDIYLKKPEEIDNYETLKELNPNLDETHQQLFADHVHEVETLIKDYAEGRASVEPDAMESMEKLLDTYGKEWVRGTASSEKLKNGVSYDITQEACDAQQRLAAERVALKELDNEVAPTLKYIRQYSDMVEELVKDVAYAGNDADREAAVAKFNKEMSKAMDEAGVNNDAHKERSRAFLESQLKNDQNLSGYLYREYNDAAQYLLDKDGKLKDGVAVYVEPENRMEKVEEKAPVVEEKTEEKDGDKLEYTDKELKAARKKAPKDRTVKDWNILYDHVDHNQELKTDKDRSKKRKELTNDLYRAGRKDVIPLVIAEQNRLHPEHTEDYIPDAKKDPRGLYKEEEKPVEEQKKDDKSDDKGDDKGRGGVTPVVVLPHHITNDKGVTEWTEDKQAPEQEKEETKKKKGLLGWIKDKAGKAKEWVKRNWKKVAIGGAILAASLFGAKQCQSQQQDDKGKDKIEVVTPTPDRQEKQEPTIVVTDSIDKPMLLQYAQRVGYTDKLGEEEAINRALEDRQAYVTNQNKSVKDRIFGINNDMTPEAQMAVLATVRNNDPKLTETVDGILKGTNHNVATAAKLSSDAAEWTAVDGKIQAVHPEKWTKETGRQTISVDQNKLNDAVANHMNNARGNQGM